MYVVNEDDGELQEKSRQCALYKKLWKDAKQELIVQQEDAQRSSHETEEVIDLQKRDIARLKDEIKLLKGEKLDLLEAFKCVRGELLDRQKTIDDLQIENARLIVTIAATQYRPISPVALTEAPVSSPTEGLPLPEPPEEKVRAMYVQKSDATTQTIVQLKRHVATQTAPVESPPPLKDLVVSAPSVVVDMKTAGQFGQIPLEFVKPKMKKSWIRIEKVNVNVTYRVTGTTSNSKIMPIVRRWFRNRIHVYLNQLCEELDA